MSPEVTWEYEDELRRLRAENVQLKAELADYRDGISWDTTCLNCASLLSRNYQDYVRAEKAVAAAAHWKEAYEKAVGVE